jgi:hypothetical protein
MRAPKWAYPTLVPYQSPSQYSLGVLANKISAYCAINLRRGNLLSEPGYDRAGCGSRRREAPGRVPRQSWVDRRQVQWARRIVHTREAPGPEAPPPLPVRVAIHFFYFF